MDLIDDDEFWKEALAIPISGGKKKKATTTTESDEKVEEIHPKINEIQLLPKQIITGYQNPIFVTRNGIYITVTGIDYQLVRKLCNRFTVKTKSNFGARWNIARSFNIIKPDKNSLMLMLPRFGFLDYFFNTLVQEFARIKDGVRKTQYADMLFVSKFLIASTANIVNQLAIHKSDPLISSTTLKLESHQLKIIDYIMNNYYNPQIAALGYAGLNLKLKTGAGKSYIAMGLIDRLKQPTLLIVHNQPQAEDMYQIAKSYFPNTTVGIYHSKEKILGQIMIVVIHSACGAEEYNFPDVVVQDPISGKPVKRAVKFTVPEFFSRFGFVIFDESHKYCSPEFSKVYTRCQAAYMLGLSATPGERIDGFDPITYWNVGQLVDIADLIPGLLQDEPFNTKILGIKYSGSPDFTSYKSNDHGMFDNNATLIQMMEDPHRLNLIVPVLEFLNEQKRNVYIFSDRLEYLNIIRRELFHSLRKTSDVKQIDTLDDDLIKFIKEKPDYQEYVKNLQEDINKQWSDTHKSWQDRLSIASTQDFYKTHHAEAIQAIKENENVGSPAGLNWYVIAYKQSSSYLSYVIELQKIAQSALIARQAFFNEVLKEESTKEYYDNLMETFRKNFIDDHIESKTSLSILTGGATGDQITQSSNKATMIFTTYGYMGTGKSIPKMDTILFVTPRRNGVEQVVGRIFRPGKNKNERWIIDIIDWKINLKSQWYERLDVYERQKTQNRNPKLCETEVNFTEVEEDHKDKKNLKDVLSEIFETKAQTINPIQRTVPFQDLVLNFSNMNVNNPIRNEPEKKKRVRIIKKF